MYFYYNEVLYFLIVLIVILNCWIAISIRKKKKGIIESTIILILFWVVYQGIEKIERDIALFFYVLIISSGIGICSYKLMNSKSSQVVRIISTTSIIIGLTIIYYYPLVFHFRFDEQEALEILNNHGIIIQDEVRLISSSKTGFYEFYHFFELELKDDDYQRLLVNYFKAKRDIDMKLNLVNKVSMERSETDTHYVLFYQTNWIKNIGEIHYDFLLSKSENVLTYVESNE